MPGPPPEEIMQSLKNYCEVEDIGLMMLGNEAGITVILMGPKNIGAGLAAVGACAMILNDLMAGTMQNRPAEEKPSPIN